MVSRYNFIQIWRTAWNYKTGSLFIKIFIIILTTSAFFLVFNFAQMMYMKNILLDKERAYQSLFIEHNIENINSRLIKIEDFIGSIVVDSELKYAIDRYNRKPRSYYDVISIYNNRSKLRATQIGDSSIKELFVYVDKSDYVATASGMTDSSIFFDAKFRETADFWHNLIDRNNYLNVAAIDVYNMSVRAPSGGGID